MRMTNPHGVPLRHFTTGGLPCRAGGLTPPINVTAAQMVRQGTSCERISMSGRSASGRLEAQP